MGIRKFCSCGKKLKFYYKMIGLAKGIAAVECSSCNFISAHYYYGFDENELKKTYDKMMEEWKEL